MLPRPLRSGSLALLLLPLLAACGDDEKLRPELEAAQAEAIAARETLERTAAELETAEATAARVSDSCRRLEAELEATKAQGDETAAELEVATRDLGVVESHRDELTAWIEGQLLPLAEKGDERLANLREVTDEIAKEVERLRGIEFRRPFMRRLIDRDEVSDFMVKDMEREIPREEARRMMLIGAEFGLVPKGTDLYDMASQFLEAGAAAFYKPQTSTFYLIEGKNDRGDRPIVFHELIHALEDQHYDLAQLQKSASETALGGHSDRFMAVRALVEGSAELHTNRYAEENPEDQAAMMQAQMTPEMMQRQMQMIQKVPPFLIASMGLYPYKNGAAWLEAIGADTPEEFRDLFENPPVSSEQVLHPEKFRTGSAPDFPHDVGYADLTGALPDGWEELERESMGELGCGMLLTQLKWNPAGNVNMMALMRMADMTTQRVSFQNPVRKAVEGWDGDRYVAWIDAAGEAVTIVWTSCWDSEQDAEEFATEYGKLLGRRVTKKAVEQMSLPARFEHPDDGTVSGVQRDGTRVVAVLSGPADSADALFAAGAAVPITPDERDPNDGK